MRYKVLLSSLDNATQEYEVADEELQEINRTLGNETCIDFYPTD